MLLAGYLQGSVFQMTDQDYNEPYSTMQRIIDAIVNFLVAIGAVAFAGIVGYFWARFL